MAAVFIAGIEEDFALKYVLLFYTTYEQQQAWEQLPEETRNAQYAKTSRWVMEHAAQIRSADKFLPPQTATTVRMQGDGEPLIHDGPFIEGNEIIGGYAMIEVADLDEALRLVKTWPARGDIVEIRPVEMRPGRAEV